MSCAPLRPLTAAWRSRAAAARRRRTVTWLLRAAIPPLTPLMSSTPRCVIPCALLRSSCALFRMPRGGAIPRGAVRGHSARHAELDRDHGPAGRRAAGAAPLTAPADEVRRHADRSTAAVNWTVDRAALPLLLNDTQLHDPPRSCRSLRPDRMTPGPSTVRPLAKVNGFTSRI